MASFFKKDVPLKGAPSSAVAQSVKPNVQLIPNVLSKDLLKKAHALFFQSNEVQYLSREENRVKIYGEYREVPRKQAAYSAPGGLTYSFSGTTVYARDEDEIPVLREIREAIENASGKSFNFGFINYYENGDKIIGWHSDDEKDMVEKATIASITFGAERDFDFRMKKDYTVKHRVVLKDNMLCLMHYPTNRDWHHSLPRRKRVKKPRVNITFRQFKDGGVSLF